MGIGHKIKEYRTKAGLTQKELADALYVTYQAVSRWENDDAEPSFDTLKEMCRILNCSTDDLFGMEKPKVEEEKKEEVPPTIVEHVVVQEAKPVLGVCERCNKPIYDADDLKRVDLSYSVRQGRSTHTIAKTGIFCEKCNNERIAEQKAALEKAERERRAGFRRRRIVSFIVGFAVAALLIALSITYFVQGKTDSGIGGLVFALFGFTFSSTLILNNTFVPDLWLTIASWGFVRLPGIIFELSFDGIVFLIVVKILFFIIGMILAVIAVLAATIIAMVMSVFAYPFAIIKNIKCEE